jgi:hypothetical protein
MSEEMNSAVSTVGRLLADGRVVAINIPVNEVSVADAFLKAVDAVKTLSREGRGSKYPVSWPLLKDSHSVWYTIGECLCGLSFVKDSSTVICMVGCDRVLSGGWYGLLPEEEVLNHFETIAGALGVQFTTG